MNLEITKEQILEVASKSAEAKQALINIFPALFEEEKYFDFTGLDPNILAGQPLPDGFNNEAIQIRTYGNFAYKGFFLSSGIKWNIITDEQGYQVLIPSKW